MRHPSPPNTYSYVQEENLGSTRKSVEISLFVYVYYQPNSCNTHAEHECAGGTFLRQRNKVPPAHAQRVNLEEPIRLPSPHQVHFSVHPSVSLSICLEYEKT